MRRLSSEARLPTIDNKDGMLRAGMASVICLQSIDLDIVSLGLISFANNRRDGAAYPQQSIASSSSYVRCGEHRRTSCGMERHVAIVGVGASGRV